MTFKEKVTQEHPEMVDEYYTGGVAQCPCHYGYEPNTSLSSCEGPSSDVCAACWNREMPEEVVDKINAVGTPNVVSSEEIPHILDSGNRREFDTGAVRDIQEGKGRCDLMPLDVVAGHMHDKALDCIWRFELIGDVCYLYDALSHFSHRYAIDTDELVHTPASRYAAMYLDVSKHFEEGAKKYGENNWQKGIPVHCYIDSAVRHYLKLMAEYSDEPHDRAFVWNLMCCIWTCEHKPELNEYGGSDEIQ